MSKKEQKTKTIEERICKDKSTFSIQISMNEEMRDGKGTYLRDNPVVWDETLITFDDEMLAKVFLAGVKQAFALTGRGINEKAGV